MSGSAFLASIARSSVILEYFQIPLALLSIVVAAGAMFALTIPEIAGAVILRAFLVLVGLALGESL